MKRTWTSEELLEHFTLLPDELAAVGNKSGTTRLGFAVLLKCLQYEGRFPRSRQEVAPEVVRFLAAQVGVDAALFAQYAWEGRTIEAHRAQIREMTKMREFHSYDEEALLNWLCTEVLTHEQHSERLRELIRAECRTRRIEAPDDIAALIEAGLVAYEAQIYIVIAARLAPEVQQHLDALLVTEPTAEGEEEAFPLTLLRLDPGPVGVESALSEIAKLRSLRAIGLPPDLFQGYAPKLVERLRRRVAAESPSHIRQHPQAIRMTLLAALVFQRTQEVTDALVTLLIQLVHRIGKRAERRVETAYLNDLKRVAGKTRILYRIADAALEHPDDPVREVVFPVANEETLRDLVAEYKAQGGAYRQQVQEVMRSSYRNHYRQILPALLEVLDFHSNNTAYQPVIQALSVVREYVSSRLSWYPIEVSPPIEGAVPSSWEDIVTEQDSAGETRVNRLTYELSVLQTLRERVRTKEIWVSGAAQFRNPEDDLPRDFDQHRATYYADLHLPLSADEFVASLKTQLTTALTSFERFMAKKPKDVAIGTKRGKGWITLSPLPKQPEPKHLPRLKTEILRRWGVIGLLDIFKEAAMLTGCLDCFQSTGSREALPPDLLHKRLLLCMYGLGTNMGIKRMAGVDPHITAEDLRYTRRRYLHKEHLRAAIAQVVNALLHVRLEAIWGEATSTCASDSKKFHAVDQNLLTQWHARYRGPGVLVYWHVERRSVCIYSQLKSCTSPEVAAMLEGVLRHCTDMTIKHHMTDSHGQSEIGFAFSHLLGFRLLPRLKPIHSQRLALVEAGTQDNYPHLKAALGKAINWDVIRQQYDMMVKYATALKTGTADADALLRRFTRSNLQHPTYQGLHELGRVMKTIFLCEFLSDPRLRQEIQEALNVIEQWNSVNGFIFSARGGELLSNRPENQEMAVLCLHLIQVSLALVNTLLLQEVLAEDAWKTPMKPEDWRGLTPLFYQHVNPYGRFTLDLTQRLPLSLTNIA
jgi:TnpA family transposase/putative NIF3 family GTP cyclohydrolase 1 type 2